MKAVVVEIIKTYTNKGGWPIAYATLDCSHGAKITFIEDKGTCLKCGLHQDIGYPAKRKSCKCGNRSFSNLESPNPHNERHRITRIGDEIDCVQCDQKAQALIELKKAIKSGHISHTRYKRGYVHVYKYDKDAPKGVLLLLSVEECPELNSILKGPLAPLSPTEPR